MIYQHIIMLLSKPTFNNGLLKSKYVDSLINLKENLMVHIECYFKLFIRIQYMV